MGVSGKCFGAWDIKQEVGYLNRRIEMADKKECFIIMPITTPDIFLEKYRDGKEHFEHVLECLFMPSIEKAGYKPIPPMAEGSDLIQANIISNLEKSDLVLCDMSCLNPNVFFEFGIRTSLNKSVCVVKDELTDKVPFDTGIINHQEYQSKLETWQIEEEIAKLSEHIKKSAERSKGENTLWKYFGLKSKAAPYETVGGSDEKLEYLSLQIESMKEKMDVLSERSTATSLNEREQESIVDKIFMRIQRIAPECVSVKGMEITSDRLVVDHTGYWPNLLKGHIKDIIFKSYGHKLEFNRIDEDVKNKD